MKHCRVDWQRGSESLGQTQLVLAHSYWHRARGLLGRPAPTPGRALEIRPCSSVHTLFMGYAIDVVFIDQEGQVVKVVHRLAPWRAAAARGARAVIEFAAGEADRLGLQAGDTCVYQSQ